MNKLVKCRSCGAEVDASVKFCPNCGAKRNTFISENRFLLVIIAVFASVGILCIVFLGPQKDAVLESKQIERQEYGSVTAQNANNKPKEKDAKTGGTLGDYYVDIKKAEIAEDYKGNPIVVITYEFTNNSDDSRSAMWAISEKAFQDGVELDDAYVVDDEIYDRDNARREIRPGTTVDVQCAFILTSDSVVEFELKELISLKREVVAVNINVARGK